MKIEVVKVSQSIEAKVKKRIQEKGRGWCFTSMSFLDLGSDVSIRKALSELQKKKIIRRISQGIYEYPKVHEVIGIVPPDLHEVAKAVAEKNGVQIQPSGAHAANLVGLSEQVPGRVIFLTEGPSRRIQVENQEIVFKKASKKVMAFANTREGLLIQAMKNIGKDHIDDIARKKIAKFLKKSSENEIRRNMRFAPFWIRSLVFEIMEFKP